MKRVFLYLAAVVVALITVGGAAYIISIVEPTNKDNNKWPHIIEYLDRISRAKHKSSHLSAHYATIATQEQQPDIALLLRAIAGADSVQCENCRRAIGVLGGKFYPPQMPLPKKISSRQHLLSTIESKSRQRQQLSLFAQQAALGHNRYVARLIVWCHESDRQQMEFIKRELSRNGATSYRSAKYYVCPKCSSLYDEQTISHLCPLCMTPFATFILFE